MGTISTDPFDIARAEGLLRGYDARWGADHFEVLAVEAEFRAPLVNPETGAPSRTWQRGGKLDVIVRDAGGRVGFIEHKSSSEDIGPGSPYWRKLRMDGQVSGYFTGSDSLGFPAEFCLYDVIGKPGIRPLKATPLEARKYTKAGALYANQREQDEAPAEYLARLVEDIAANPAAYYQRGEVVRLSGEMEEAAFDDWQTAQALREAQRLGRFPRNPDACMKWGRPCDFFDVCTAEASIDDPARFRRSEHVNPELEDRGGLPVLSASRLRTARACQRLHRFEYLDGYRPVVEAEALRFGSLIHLGLEAWWKAKDGERLEAALAAIAAPALTKSAA